MASSFRIWHCTRVDPSAVGGVEQHIAGVCAALERMAHLTFIGTPGRVASALDAASGPLIVHTHGDSWFSPRLLAEKRKRRAVHVHVCHGNTLERMRACREHASFSGWKGAARDFSLLAFCDAAVAVSPHALEETRRYYRFSKPAWVIANGADLSVFRPLPEVAAEPRLIFVGRSDDRVKNAAVLLDACRRVRARHPDFELLAAPGIDPAPPFVKRLGKLSPAELARELGRSRALALCSFYEGDPLVLREAMAMGLPVVASDIPAVRETLGGYANAALFGPRDPRVLADAIERALYGEKPVPKPSLRGWDEVAREYVELYESLFRSRKARTS